MPDFGNVQLLQAGVQGHLSLPFCRHQTSPSARCVLVAMASWPCCILPESLDASVFTFMFTGPSRADQYENDDAAYSNAAPVTATHVTYLLHFTWRFGGFKQQKRLRHCMCWCRLVSRSRSKGPVASSRFSWATRQTPSWNACSVWFHLPRNSNSSSALCPHS